MSDFSRFMKKNKVQRQNLLYPATKSLMDENGQPLLWELRPLTTAEVDRIRESCTTEKQIPGKPGLYRPKTDMAQYQLKMLCAAILSPDLHDKELQDSYGVMSAEELLTQMVDNPGEYADLLVEAQKLNGFSTLQEDVDEAKNS